MISFRFHLVSITAIFLALAAGIAVGAAVVDRASVELLRTQLDEVEARRQATNARNDELKAGLDEWNRYAEQAGNQLIAGQLASATGGIPVFVVAIEGVERNEVTALETSLGVAGAAYQGTVWLTRKWALDTNEAADEMAAALEVGTNLLPETLRRAGIARLGRALLDGDPADLLVSLQAGGFIEHVSAEGGPPLAAIPTEDAVVIAVAGDGPLAEQRGLAINLVEVMATTREAFIAAQPATPTEDGTGTAFVTQVRTDTDLATQLTTVDSLSDYRGRVATVLAVKALTLGITGHYGLGPHAERVLPELPPPAVAP